MFRRLSPAAFGLALAGLLVVPACDQKKPTAPDAPPEQPDGPGPISIPDPNQKLDPSLPSPPAQRPLFGTGPLTVQFRQISSNNLKQIGLAFHNFHDNMNGFPVGIADKSGKVGLSWRVAILPYLEQEGLYKQFKLDEPWDSTHNRKLIPKMPATYAPPRTDTNGYTYYRSFSGKGAVMPPPGAPGRPGQPVIGAKVFAIPDGASNTLLVAEAYDPVIWTKPDDLSFVPGKPPKLGGGMFGTGFHAALCDGSVRFLPMSIDPKTLSDAIQTDDGNRVELP